MPKFPSPETNQAFSSSVACATIGLVLSLCSGKGISSFKLDWEFWGKYTFESDHSGQEQDRQDDDKHTNQQ